MQEKINNLLHIESGIPHRAEALVALCALVIASPMIALAALAIAATSMGPVIFRQRRIGLNGRSFTLYKLRTMRASQSGPQVTADDDTRVTPVGKFLRKTKIDELPELWNVVKGDMSLVGPRPEVPKYVDLQNPDWQLALRARPGITDPTTLRLRNEQSLLADVEGDREHFYLHTLQPYKLQGYLEYLRGRSWWSDVKILVLTSLAIVMPGRAAPPSVHELMLRSENGESRQLIHHGGAEEEEESSNYE